MIKYYARTPRNAGGVSHYNGTTGPFTSFVNDGAHFVDVIINLRRAAQQAIPLYTSIIVAIISSDIDWR